MIFYIITANVSQLHEVWEKVRLNFRLKTELSDTKPTLKFAKKPNLV